MKAVKVMIIVALTSSAAAFACGPQAPGAHTKRSPQDTASLVDSALGKGGVAAKTTSTTATRATR